MSDRKTARERALRAACAVTLGLATGCAASHQPDRETTDAGHDTGPVADAGCPEWTFDRPPTSSECCLAEGFSWDPAGAQCIIAVPGPFVPPAMA